jgi:2,4-dienoyl-CoA reductase-like NADH-dependent reductase (Old Yellow Enzyme family)
MSGAHSAFFTPYKIHSFGSKIVLQLADGGVASNPAAIDGVPRGASGYLPGTREMSIPEIEDLVQAFANAAKRAVRIGWDGVMVHCAHGYGLSQFLSPFSNRRTDRYGGSIENRARIVQEIVMELKKVVPDRFAIVCKINGHDGLENGVTPEICARNVELLSKEGVHLFEISTRFQDRMVMSRAILQEGRTVRGGSSEEIAQWKEILKKINPAFPFSYGYTARYAEVVRKKKTHGAIWQSLVEIGISWIWKSSSRMGNVSWCQLQGR